MPKNEFHTHCSLRQVFIALLKRYSESWSEDISPLSVSSPRRSWLTVGAKNCIAGDNKKWWFQCFLSICILILYQSLRNPHTHAVPYTHKTRTRAHTHAGTNVNPQLPCHSASEVCRSLIGSLWNGKEIRANKQTNTIKPNLCWFSAHRGGGGGGLGGGSGIEGVKGGKWCERERESSARPNYQPGQ